MRDNTSSADVELFSYGAGLYLLVGGWLSYVIVFGFISEVFR